ncbi:MULTISPECIES: hypothetical protein [unclassified Endozoicomonas]|nr:MULTISPECIES: hypothetical protein [unclassified Endozoicomonas]
MKPKIAVTPLTRIEATPIHDKEVANSRTSTDTHMTEHLQINIS